MSVFTLAISCLTTSNLPWFVDLTFQVPMQYCSLQHQTLLLSPVISTTGCCFCFGSISSFFLELFLHWSPVAYWAPTDQGRSSFSVLSFCPFILFMGFSRQEYWSGLPFPSLVDHVLLELSTMTNLSYQSPPLFLSLGAFLEKKSLKKKGICSLLGCFIDNLPWLFFLFFSNKDHAQRSQKTNKDLTFISIWISWKETLNLEHFPCFTGA